MDSDSSSKAINRSGSSSFIIRAPPSYDSDSENIIKSKQTSSSSSSCSNSDGGFVSGEEEFETASERPLMADPDEEIVDSVVGSDLIGKSFVGLRPVAKISSIDDDDDDDDDEDVVDDGSYGVLGGSKDRVLRGEGVEGEEEEGVLERVSEKVSTLVGELGSIISGGGGLFRAFGRGGGGSGDKNEVEGVGLNGKGVLGGERDDVGGVEATGNDNFGVAEGHYARENSGRGHLFRSFAFGHLDDVSEFEGVGFGREGVSGGEGRKGKGIEEEGGVEKGAVGGGKVTGNDEFGVVEGEKAIGNNELRVGEGGKVIGNDELSAGEGGKVIGDHELGVSEGGKVIGDHELGVSKGGKVIVDNELGVAVGGKVIGNNGLGVLEVSDSLANREVESHELKVGEEAAKTVENEDLEGDGTVVFVDAIQQPDEETAKETKNEALDVDHAVVEGENHITESSEPKDEGTVKYEEVVGELKDKDSVKELKNEGLVAVGCVPLEEANQQPIEEVVKELENEAFDGGHAIAAPTVEASLVTETNGQSSEVVGTPEEQKILETNETLSLASGYDQSSREAEVPLDVQLARGESVDLASKVNAVTKEPELLVLETVAGGVDRREESVDAVIEDKVVDASADESENLTPVKNEKSGLELGSRADSEAEQKEPILIVTGVIGDSESTQPENDATLLSAQKAEDEPGSEIASDEVSNAEVVNSATESTEAIIAAQNDDTPVSTQDIGARSLESSERGLTVNPEVKLDTEVEANFNSADDDNDEENDGETNEVIFGSSAAAKRFMEELERGSGADLGNSQRIDGQIATDSDEEVDTDEEGDGKELFDSAALSALLKAATESASGSDGGNITFTSPDGSKFFSLERPAGLGSSLRALKPASRPIRPNIFGPSSLMTGGESGNNLSDEDKKKLEKVQEIRVKFLRLVQKLGHSPDDSIAAQVLYRLALVAGRQTSPLFSLDAAKTSAEQLEAEGKDDLDFSLNVLVLGKTGVGKSATINSIFGEVKAVIDAFEPATTTVKEISGTVDGVKIRVFDTPGLKSSVMEQGFNRKILSQVKKFTKKCPPDIVLYVDRLDTQTRDLNDLPLLRSISNSLGSSIWRSVVVTLTHAASAPPDGPSGSPMSYDVFVSQRSNVVQQSIGQAVGDMRLMNPTSMNPVSLAENHPSCRKNREGQKVLPNGQAWRSQLLMLCYSMKILSEASSLSKPQDVFDPRKIFGIRARSPPLPYLLSSLLQSRAHPKLSTDQGGDNGDSDVDLDDLSDSEQEEEEDEYDQLPPFKPLKKTQVAKLSNEQKKAYFEEYDYRVKLLQKKQWREELKRMKELKKRGKDGQDELGGFVGEDVDQENGTPSAVAVPLPDMVLPPSFDCDNPAYRYRFLEPTSQFLARPVLDTHGWDHDCGYDGVNLEQSLAIAGQFPTSISVQITKDKKEFNIHLDSSVSAKHGESGSSLAGFDIQTIGKQLAYILRGETKFKSFKKNKTAAGVSLTFLGENVATGVKVEDQIAIGKRVVLVGSTGTVRSQGDSAYGANLEVRLRESDFPIGQDQSTLGLSLIKWRGDLALGANFQSQFAIGRGSKMAVRVGLNNKLSGQISVRTSSSDQLQLALAGLVPIAISIYKGIWPGVSENYSIY